MAKSKKGSKKGMRGKLADKIKGSSYDSYDASYDASYESSYAAGDFAFGLCDCCDDWSTCCFALWCLPCQQQQTHAWLENRHPECCPEWSVGTLMCLLPYVGQLATMCCVGFDRNTIKEKYGIGSGTFDCCDCLATVFCTCCAAIQQAREIQSRGDVPRPKTRSSSRKGKGRGGKGRGGKGSSKGRAKGKSSRSRSRR
ncbi:uncharacterized protein AMSG_06069 [Thecamonas trahens ATCC 50062]|uniref:PLAC8 family protein n=1 Tax=Thecamonas trahens ATCC 50062 TaxID=461836 RepID=A0A0L0DC25_THETB|nr:hypothetical protein AMSG_06069 [Thecamonas trahens ATCC 50062]KNC49790.1 hypothetical protein AMSG_06069 [Thecamonas trahens ATCC 50062]|eukprot:XP_013757574.1 hypothetical protein AMSG_06069 [Thecamonas trahens ATCC 50062]